MSRWSIYQIWSRSILTPLPKWQCAGASHVWLAKLCELSVSPPFLVQSTQVLQSSLCKLDAFRAFLIFVCLFVWQRNSLSGKSKVAAWFINGGTEDKVVLLGRVVDRLIARCYTFDVTVCHSLQSHVWFHIALLCILPGRSLTGSYCRARHESSVAARRRSFYPCADFPCP